MSADQLVTVEGRNWTTSSLPARSSSARVSGSILLFRPRSYRLTAGGSVEQSIDVFT